MMATMQVAPPRNAHKPSMHRHKKRGTAGHPRGKSTVPQGADAALQDAAQPKIYHGGRVISRGELRIARAMTGFLEGAADELVSILFKMAGIAAAAFLAELLHESLGLMIGLIGVVVLARLVNR